MLSDIEIARQASLEPLATIAQNLGIDQKFLEYYGPHKAKISLDILEKLKGRSQGKYIDVTAITPTPFGEGKTLTTLGLGQAFKRLGKSCVTCIRQPSLGPVFGIKGGAAGGGYAQVVPMEDVNLHLTGDFHAVSAAHNLCAAFVDNHIFHGNELNIDPETICWPRTLDISDRYLREAEIGIAGPKSGIPRKAQWVITSASELMAILCLHEGLGELRDAVSKIVVAYTYDKKPVTAEDLKVAGAMTILLKDAVKPTLMQNLEGGAVLVHTGPFANIAPGNSSIVADRIGLKLAEYTLTESGFGADMGCEKFMNIKCRKSGLRPNCVVIVATVRALKSHSGRFELKAGKALPQELLNEDLESLKLGIPNLLRHIENCKNFGVPVVVAINAFSGDSEREFACIKEAACQAGAFDCVVHHMHARGAEGGLELAKACMKACELESKLHFSYELEDSLHTKIEKLACTIFRATGVDYTDEASAALDRLNFGGYDKLPVCIAKTPLSISDKPELKGAPDNWRLQVRDLKLSAGAGFVYALCGSILTMPGLPKTPAGMFMDIDSSGKITGLF